MHKLNTIAINIKRIEWARTLSSVSARKSRRRRSANSDPLVGVQKKNNAVDRETQRRPFLMIHYD